jgi:hypothetical protein
LAVGQLVARQRELGLWWRQQRQQQQQHQQATVAAAAAAAAAATAAGIIRMWAVLPRQAAAPRLLRLLAPVSRCARYFAVQPTLAERAQEYAARHASASQGIAVIPEIQHMTVVPMPMLSPSMASATITRWMLDVGDEFESGELFVEITTDSLLETGSQTFEMEVESWEDGHLARIVAPVGSVVAPGDPIALLVDEKEQLRQWAHWGHDLEDVPSEAYTRRFAWQAYIKTKGDGMGGCS